MDTIIKPKKLHGNVDAISSKSFAHRILLAASLCEEETMVMMNHISADIRATIDAIKSMGSEVIEIGGGVRVIPRGKLQNIQINCNESGTTGRLILPIMTAISANGTLHGEGSLLYRPFETLCKALENGGVKFDNYKLPISYEGYLKPGTFSIPGNESSQYISGLMYALPLLSGDSKINLTTNLESKGYIDITLEVLSEFGIKSGYIIKGNQKYISPRKITVEGDWSNASYWICAGIIPDGLNDKSVQKDRVFAEIYDDDTIDAKEIPDLVPAIAVYATQKKTPTKIINIKRLKIKESDRIKSICNMIESLGGKINADDNQMEVYPSRLVGGVVNSFNDHRIVMAAAVGATFCSEPVIILNSEAVNKSYGTFFEDYKRLGGEVDVV